MDTDDFTEAARAEAEARFLTNGHTWAGTNSALGFREGAEWARTHLAAQETDGEKAVRELHREVIVYELDSMNGTWVYGEHDERVVLRRYCAECSSEDVIHAVEDHDWMEDWGYAWEVDWPCATIRALDSARAARRDEEQR